MFLIVIVRQNTKLNKLTGRLQCLEEVTINYLIYLPILF